MIKVADRVAETTTTIGTGTVSLDGAKTGYQGFVAAIGTGHQCYYCIVGGSEWEVGIGTVTDATPDTLSRTTVLASSNSGSLVSFSTGDKDVFVPGAAELVGRDLGKLISGETYRVEADVGIGVADGNPVSTWADQSGNGNDFVESTNPPTFRAADVDDGLPYVEFDGTNDVLERIFGALITTSELTVYCVLRAPVQLSTRVAMSASVSGVGEGGTAGFGLTTSSTGQTDWRRAGATQGFNAEFRQGTQWIVCAARWEVRQGRAVLSIVLGGNYSSRDLGATSLPAFAFDRVRLGAVYGNFGLVDDPVNGHMRHSSLYQTAHTDEEMRQMLHYLRNKWKADQPFA